MVDFRILRSSIGTISGDVSTDAIGSQAPTIEQMVAPERHAAALDPATPIVVGARGVGKSFWSGVLGNDEVRFAAATAYPQLGLRQTRTQFGFTGLTGATSQEGLDDAVPANATPAQARAYWWATVLRAVAGDTGEAMLAPRRYLALAEDWEQRELFLAKTEQRLEASGQTLLVIYDALDTVAADWPRRRLLTQALLEVVWATRAYRRIRLKAFMRPDQLEDEGLRFVELPKLRTGAVRLLWSKTDLYGLLFARLAMAVRSEQREAFTALMSKLQLPGGDRQTILSRQWILSGDASSQERVIDSLSGRYMGEGPHANKKGRVYEWVYAHLGDANQEVTPRSFLGLWIAAANYGAPPLDKAVNADGIRHGLRAASKTRVDQLADEFLWIKGVLTPLAGLLLPQSKDRVFDVWREARTVHFVLQDAQLRHYLHPFSGEGDPREEDIYGALEKIAIMHSRNDGRLDMPDLFRVAARLLKKGGTAPV